MAKTLREIWYTCRGGAKGYDALLIERTDGKFLWLLSLCAKGILANVRKVGWETEEVVDARDAQYMAAVDGEGLKRIDPEVQRLLRDEQKRNSNERIIRSRGLKHPPRQQTETRTDASNGAKILPFRRK